MEKVHMDSVGLADNQRGERHCGNQEDRSRLLSQFSWQEHSLPTDHKELVCRGGARGHTCSSSKAVWLVFCQTAVTAHSRNLEYTRDQKLIFPPPAAKAQKAQPEPLCSSHFFSRRGITSISPEKNVIYPMSFGCLAASLVEVNQ